MNQSPDVHDAPIAELLPELDQLAIDAMVDWKGPGAALVVVRDGKVALAKAHGHRDAKHVAEEFVEGEAQSISIELRRRKHVVNEKVRHDSHRPAIAELLLFAHSAPPFGSNERSGSCSPINESPDVVRPEASL